jgi:hypothetical protein
MLEKQMQNPLSSRAEGEAATFANSNRDLRAPRGGGQPNTGQGVKAVD